MLCTSGAALAQQSGSAKDDDIVVTASKREQNLQDVPLAITAIGTEKLNELQVKEFQDVVKFLPSVTIQSLGPGFSQVYFRGVRSEEHTSELQSLMRISYAVFCLKKNTKYNDTTEHSKHKHTILTQTK